MSNTVTYDPSSGESIVQMSGGRNIGHVGITAGGRDDFTGELLEPDVRPDQFEDSGWDALPPEYHIQQRLSPITDQTSTEDQVRAWLQTPGEVTQDQMEGLIEAWNQNGTPDHERDVLVELLCFKEGSVSYQDLSPEALELLGEEAVYEDSSGEEFEEGLDALIQELPDEVQQQIDRMDESSREDAELLGRAVLETSQDPEVADEQQVMADELFSSGDYAGAMISSLSAKFHAGEISQTEAIQLAIEKMGFKQAVDAYTRLALGYSATGNETTYGRQTRNDYDTNY